MVVPFGSARWTALPDDLSSDRDPEEEHPRRYVHGYHLLVLSPGSGRVAVVVVPPPTALSLVALAGISAQSGE